MTGTLVFADGLVTKDDVDIVTGEPGDREQWTYTTYRGRIRMSGPVDIVASYTYGDGELRFSDFSFPDPVGDFGYEVTSVSSHTLGAAGMIRPPSLSAHTGDRDNQDAPPNRVLPEPTRDSTLNGPKRCPVLDAPC